MCQSGNFGSACKYGVSHAGIDYGQNNIQLEEGQVGHEVVRVILDLLAEVLLENAGVLRVISSHAADQLVAVERQNEQIVSWAVREQ